MGTFEKSANGLPLATGLMEASAKLHESVPSGDLTCSACVWTARALRGALVEKMPKRVRKAKQRREMTADVLAAEGEA